MDSEALLMLGILALVGLMIVCGFALAIVDTLVQGGIL